MLPNEWTLFQHMPQITGVPIDQCHATKDTMCIILPFISSFSTLEFYCFISKTNQTSNDNKRIFTAKCSTLFCYIAHPAMTISIIILISITHLCLTHVPMICNHDSDIKEKLYNPIPSLNFLRQGKVNNLSPDLNSFIRRDCALPKTSQHNARTILL